MSFGAVDFLRLARYQHAFPRHSHEEYTVAVFETGNGTLAYRQATWPAVDGSILAVPPDEAHAAEPRPDSGWSYRAVYPSAALMAVALDRDGRVETPAFFAEPVIEDPELARRLSRVLRLLEIGVVTLETETVLLTSLHSLVARHGVVPRSRPDRPREQVVARAREYLHAHYAEAINLARLSAACGASPFHLVRSFGRSVGMPPHTYLTQLRVNRARALLLSGETLARAAYRCGFCDQSHLTRAFKRVVGVTPGAYLTALRPAGQVH
jgi:AraC-like DNA-binding protein